MSGSARLLDDGRVLLEPVGAALCAMALDAALRSRQRNGRGPDDRLRWVASVLALAAPDTAVHLPALLATAGPDVVAVVREQAVVLAVTVAAPGASQPAVTVAAQASQAPCSETGSTLTTTEVARLSGRTTHGVRAACRCGRVAAVKDEDGEWRIDRQAAAEWSAK